MKESEARAHMNNMLIAMQKLRSNAMDELAKPPYTEKDVRTVLADLQPWVFGKKGEMVIAYLQKVLDSELVRGIDFYNIMVILDTQAPQISGIAKILGMPEFPKPNFTWVMGLEPEPLFDKTNEDKPLIGKWE